MTASFEARWSESRRNFLLSMLASATSATTLAGAISGCRSRDAEIPGNLLGPDIELGHQLRDQKLPAAEVVDWKQIDTVIVGGGIAGLAAGWRLLRQGKTDFQILELESVAGGTSRSGQSAVSSYPWGAHYVPLPNAGNPILLQLFEEMGAVKKSAETQVWEASEEVACRPPQERLFAAGNWQSGFYPHSIADETDLRQWNRFQDLIHHWIDWRDSKGRRAFTIPLDFCSDAEEVTRLDKISAAAWLDQQELTSKPLRWLIDYCCRDDYGLTSEQTSAWAALFYFASRLEKSGNPEPSLLTWPAGNGEIVNYFIDVIGDRLKTGRAVYSISQENAQSGLSESSDVRQTSQSTSGDLQVRFNEKSTGKHQGIQAKQLIFAAPQFLAARLIPHFPELRRQQLRNFQYGAWIVANLHLSGRPAAGAYPLCWDNVLYESPSLGYVVATHQTGSDYGPTVWTWYMPLCDPFPAKDRMRLMNASHAEWTNIILEDLKVAHPDLRKFLTRLDIFRWGHAMIQPRPEFLWSESRLAAKNALGNIHFAGTDLSGVALMEEAFYQGVRAADEILQNV